jgi:hypothetical protein
VGSLPVRVPPAPSRYFHFDRPDSHLIHPTPARHIYPKKYLDGHINSGLADALANIAVIGPSINSRISAKAPLAYVTRYRITPSKLQQQFIDPHLSNLPITEFDSWTQSGADPLALEANSYLTELKKDL